MEVGGISTAQINQPACELVFNSITEASEKSSFSCRVYYDEKRDGLVQEYESDIGEKLVFILRR